MLDAKQTDPPAYREGVSIIVTDAVDLNRKRRMEVEMIIWKWK